MKPKIKVYSAVRFAVAILVIAGLVKAATMLAVRGPAGYEALPDSSMGLQEEEALPDSSMGLQEEEALSGSSAFLKEGGALPDSSVNKQETGTLPEGSADLQDADHSPQEEKKIALTFDDGPDEECTPMLLDGLAKRGVKATFFVIGKEAERQPEIMQRIVKEGHLIGNHTYNHVDIRHMTESAAKEEILKANEVIAKYTGEEPCFLRPPFGNGSGKLEKDMEMIQVLWTIDTMDWSCKNESKICKTVYRELKENSIILMHDEYPATVRAALNIIDHLQKEGYTFVTVDEIVMD